MLIPHDIQVFLESFRDYSLIVEGKKDKKALESLGLDNIFEISGKSVERLLLKLPRDRKYVVLTDFDREGEDKKRKIYKLFEKNRMSFNPSLRRKVKDFFKVSKIEELISISKLMEDVYYGKISTVNYKVFNRSKLYRKWCSREARRNWGNIWSD